MTAILCESIFGKRNTKWEVNASTFHDRPRGMKHYMHEMVLKQAITKGKITKHQSDWVSAVWNKTLSNGRTNWSTNIASSIELYTKTQEKPIIAELRSQGQGKHARTVPSGCVYYDCKSEEDIAYLTKVIYDSTSLFTEQCKRKKNKKIKPLDINDPSDFIVLKAIVYGLFTRPRMCCWIKTDIIDGAITENTPRCISEDTLRKIQLNKHEKHQQENAMIQRRILEQKAKAVQRSKFLTWSRSFITHMCEEKRIIDSLKTINGENVENWEDAW